MACQLTISEAFLFFCKFIFCCCLLEFWGILCCIGRECWLWICAACWTYSGPSFGLDKFEVHSEDGMILGFFEGIGAGVIALAAADRFLRSLNAWLRSAPVLAGGLGGFDSFFRCLYRLLSSALFLPGRLFAHASVVGTTSLHHISLLV